MNTEINSVENKKVWRTPVLEVVPVEETLSGIINSVMESGYTYSS
jgi:hypothetical protein